MAALTVLALCSFAMGAVHSELTWRPDNPYMSFALFEPAELMCCFTVTSGNTGSVHWVRSFNGAGTISVNLKDGVTSNTQSYRGENCSVLIFKSVKLNDSGLYQCLLNTKGHFSHGTYMQVFQPLKKRINLKETTKNSILTAEGILLLLCVLLPSATLLCKSKKLVQLEKKKAGKEEENIYQGLNLDECSATYDEIVRTQGQYLYEDVGNMKEELEEEEIQLEKP
ncbi:B-cell antigen receptor complex-associated protein alpha chain [Cynoglossus semilaevis]|uniref:CD79a molecule, immunoglobulin-associated alpha n=1 Tax=Cynoglossus semilaevis TaxID=244447 RepID=A0A3P8VUZ7_CYNSE|nr:B-cell antigen receptor complex-associated protein alpha chain [Cynoglossus semilaevis]